MQNKYFNDFAIAIKFFTPLAINENIRKFSEKQPMNLNYIKDICQRYRNDVLHKNYLINLLQEEYYNRKSIEEKYIQLLSNIKETYTTQYMNCLKNIFTFIYEEEFRKREELFAQYSYSCEKILVLINKMKESNEYLNNQKIVNLNNEYNFQYEVMLSNEYNQRLNIIINENNIFKNINITFDIELNILFKRNEVPNISKITNEIDKKKQMYINNIDSKLINLVTKENELKITMENMQLKQIEYINTEKEIYLKGKNDLKGFKGTVDSNISEIYISVYNDLLENINITIKELEKTIISRLEHMEELTEEIKIASLNLIKNMNNLNYDHSFKNQ